MPMRATSATARVAAPTTLVTSNPAKILAFAPSSTMSQRAFAQQAHMKKMVTVSRTAHAPQRHAMDMVHARRKTDRFSARVMRSKAGPGHFVTSATPRRVTTRMAREAAPQTLACPTPAPCQIRPYAQMTMASPNAAVMSGTTLRTTPA